MGVEWDRSSDEELLGAARRAPAAFGVFYERYEERMLRYFLARVGDAEVAADLTAETFAAALAGAHRFRPRKGPAAAWLFGIARNTLAMSRRRGRVEARARRALGAPVLVLTDEVIERIEALGGPALELVDALPPDERVAVRARVLDERDYSDIAKLTLANPNRDARVVLSEPWSPEPWEGDPIRFVYIVMDGTPYELPEFHELELRATLTNGDVVELTGSG